MTDERHRNRHRERSESAGMDPDRLRYFTQSNEARPSTRHRRRRAPGAPADPFVTGQIPKITDSPPVAEPDEASPAPATMRDRAGRNPSPQAAVVNPAGVDPVGTDDGVIDTDVRDAAKERPALVDDVHDESEQPPRTDTDGSEAHSNETHSNEADAGDIDAADTAAFESVAPEADQPVSTDTDVFGASEVPADSIIPTDPAIPTDPEDPAHPEGPAHPEDIAAAEPDYLDWPPAGSDDRDWAQQEWNPEESAQQEWAQQEWAQQDWAGADTGRSRAGAERIAPGALTALADPTDRADHEPGSLRDRALDESAFDDPVFDDPDLADHPERRPAALRRRRRRRIGMAIAVVVMLLVIAGVGVFGAAKAGLFDSRKDFSNASGTSDVLVYIPSDTTIKQIGSILVDDNVVGSVRAFVNAAGDSALSGGYYKMRTEIPASTAVSMMSDSESTHRVGRIVIPPGLPLASKKDSSGRITPGIFEMISAQTGVEINGDRLGATVQQLEQAASEGTIAQLGIPEWAQDAATKLAGDSRRIEGLIAPGTWEDIDPNRSATEILHSLITQSAQRYEQWGLLSNNSSGLSPYQTLVAASLLQGEVQPDDYAKVARVILNRLDKGQKLEFDSTANYTANVVDLNVHDDDLKADTPWNTYVQQGLPPTPIGAVEDAALTAMEQPSQGDWLYFVTVDKSGTTLFTDDFNQHRRNIAKACENKFITCR